jgi:hypothetical protein
MVFSEKIIFFGMEKPPFISLSTNPLNGKIVPIIAIIPKRAIDAVNPENCLKLILNLVWQPEDQLWTTDERFVPLRNTARARHNPEASGLLWKPQLVFSKIIIRTILDRTKSDH